LSINILPLLQYLLLRIKHSQTPNATNTKAQAGLNNAERKERNKNRGATKQLGNLCHTKSMSYEQAAEKTTTIATINHRPLSYKHLKKLPQHVCGRKW